MKTETHTITCSSGTFRVRLDIHHMEHQEAVDVYDLPEENYKHGGYRIEGFVNDVSTGSKFYSGSLDEDYWGGRTDIAARNVLSDYLATDGRQGRAA